MHEKELRGVVHKPEREHTVIVQRLKVIKVKRSHTSYRHRTVSKDITVE